MSILMDFYAIDSSQLTENYLENHLAHADFSLRLSDIDLGYLTKLISRMLERKPIFFTDHLTPLMINEPDHLDIIDDFESEPETYLLSTEIKELLAVFPEEKVVELVSRWFELLSSKYDDVSQKPSSEAIKAVKQLLELCRLAVKEKVDVIYRWSL